MATVSQIPLGFTNPTSFDLADFIVSNSNKDAVSFLESWKSWPQHFNALTGPRASGKSHLLHGWAKESGAVLLLPDVDIAALEPRGLYIIDDIDRRHADGSFVFGDTALFHLYNWLREIDAYMLVTASSPPNMWQRTLPDLISRLGTVPVALIHEPDDELLLSILIKLFSDRQLQVNIEVIHYILSRMERSFEAAQSLVETIDTAALAAQRKVTKALVRECLVQGV